MRQIAGIDSNKLQPMIRYHPDSDYRVQFIPFASIDYFSYFATGTAQSQHSSVHRRMRNADNKKASQQSTVSQQQSKSRR